MQRRGSTSRLLLDLSGGDRRGLARAFQWLVGQSTPTSPTLAILQKLNFEFTPQEDSTNLLLSHGLVPERKTVLRLSQEPSDPVGFVVSFVNEHFSEMSFYLPFITLRTAYQKQTVVVGGALPPEPDYDEDGFLSD